MSGYCNNCGTHVQPDGKCMCGALDWGPPLSDSEQIPKPPTREGGGVRSSDLMGFMRAEASGGSSAIQPGGAGKATEGSAEPEAQARANSQLPDGLPSRGDGESERFLLAAGSHLLKEARWVIEHTAPACSCDECTREAKKVCHDIDLFLACVWAANKTAPRNNSDAWRRADRRR